MSLYRWYDRFSDWLFDAPLIPLLLLATAVAAPCFGWYSAGLQAAKYRQQGINMTQWECFIGIEPAERVVQVRERP